MPVDELNKKLVNDTFNCAYNEEQFKLFVKDLLIDANFEKAHNIMLPNDYKDFIKSARRICKYKYVSEEYVDEKVIDVLVVKLKRNTSVERARVAQRNFVARYLNGSRDYQKDAALVAFISEDENENISPDWRFSFVQMNYKTEIVESPNGKKKRVTSVELTPAKRFSFLVGESEDTHTAQKQFATCLEKSSKGEKITIEDLVQAFDIEKVSKEFFDKYKALYLKLRNELNRLCEEDKIVNKDFVEHNINIDDFAKKTLGQLVFLYFIQKKGWLGVQKDKDWGTGDKKFLRNVFDKKYCQYENFFNDILEHLFYEALATDRGQSAWFDKLNCRIPFLNGGLFEPVNGYEYQKTDLTINNSVFKEIFETFDLYNFTVKEDEPLEKEVAIDPEMLGKVFENLLPENERKGNGAFYTPREIVHYMCQESLINYLYNKINIKEVPLTEEEKNQQLSLLKTKKEKEQLKLTHEVIEEVISKEDIEFLVKTGNSTYINKTRGINVTLPDTIKNNASLIDKALSDIKVCDPAIGSGAFPVGMMNEIVRARATLSEFLKPDRPIYELKRNVIENSIYGVDIDPGAVDIAKLRFWLSLVVDEEDVKNIKPLPNLDYKIMQGNSLITSFEGIDFDEIVAKQEKVKQLGLFSSASERITDKISSKQNEFLNTPYPTRKVEIKQEIENLIVELVKTKFEEKAEKEGKSKDFYEEQIRNFAQNKEKRDFFPWKLFFADVFENGGFDVVIGNPPYINTNEMKDYKDIYRNLYNTAHGSYDIYVLFYEKGLGLLKRNAHLTYITSNKYLISDYGIKLRKLFKENTQIQNIMDLADCKRVFSSALVSPCITAVNNCIPNNDTSVNIFILKDNDVSNLNNISPKIIKQCNLGDNKNCTFDIQVNTESQNILLKLLNNSSSLEEIAEVRTGVMGFDYWSLDEYISEKPSNNAIRIATNSFIAPYRFLWGKKINLYKKNYFNTWLDIDNCPLNENTKELFKTPKIIIRGVAQKLTATLDNDGVGLLVAVHSAIVKNESITPTLYVLALLNSKLLNWYHLIKFYTARIPEGSLKYPISFLKTIPIKNANANIQEKFNKKVQTVINMYNDSNQEQNIKNFEMVDEVENQIDIMVYKLYDLTYSEVQTIDPTFPSVISEEEYDNYMI